MSTILIPTDFSNNARNAFEYGLSLLGEEHEYILFNAYEEPKSTATSMVSLKDILVEASEDSLKDEKAFFVERHPSLNISMVSEYGDPTFAVTNFAKKNEVDMIVMGTAGVTGLQKIFLGSVASAVIEKAVCPVVVVPRGYQFEPLENVLFTADLLNAEDETLPKALVDIVTRNNSEVTVLTVNKPNQVIDAEKAEKGFSLHMAMHGFPHKFDVIESDDVHRAIETYANENDMQLLVTTPRKSSWFQRLLKPSVTKELAEHLQIPMFAIH